MNGDLSPLVGYFTTFNNWSTIFSKNKKSLFTTFNFEKWWEETVIKLKDVFMKDNDFKERMWLKQLAVLKRSSI